MLELIDKSDKVRRFAYWLMTTMIAVAFIWRLPEILSAIKGW